VDSYTAFVVSDGTGRTAERALDAALTQFANVKLDVVRVQNIRTRDEVVRVVREAAAANAFIIHTLVTDELRGHILRIGRQYNVETIDLMGTLLGRLSELFSVSPAEKPGLFSQLNRVYFRRIESMEFAINHDDGLRVEELKDAEIVLLGVSRTFKTPISVYLAYRGWFVGNVPILLNVPIPDIITELPPQNVFCLDTNPARLAELRRTREEYLRGSVGEYADPDFVRREVHWARGVFTQKSKWRVIDVTNKSIEEISSEILLLKGGEFEP
jgi:regulator of PEP synthase PpsR (kinase-PPPase family)